MSTPLATVMKNCNKSPYELFCAKERRKIAKENQGKDAKDKIKGKKLLVELSTRWKLGKKNMKRRRRWRFKNKLSKEKLVQKGYIHDLAGDYEQMKKWYMAAVKKGCVNSMYILGNYYEEVENNYDQMKKYYLMAIEHGCEISMNALGFHYDHVEKDYDEMKKYYLMSIEGGYTLAMYNLGDYYKKTKDYVQMKKYYLMAIEKGCAFSMNNLGNYYAHVENDYEQTKKYYLMAIEHGLTVSITNLSCYYSENDHYDEMMAFYITIIEEKDVVGGKELAMEGINDNIKDEDLSKYKKYLDKINKTYLNEMMTVYYKMKNCFIVEEEKCECPICYEEKETIHLNCNHKVCYVCYDEILKCPLCRDEF